VNLHGARQNKPPGTVIVGCVGGEHRLILQHLCRE
jgi:hypothetical protein